MIEANGLRQSAFPANRVEDLRWREMVISDHHGRRSSLCTFQLQALNTPSHVLSKPNRLMAASFLPERSGPSKEQ